MSDVVNEAVAALNAKMDGGGFDGTAKFDITDEGAIIIDADGARASDEREEDEQPHGVFSSPCTSARAISTAPTPSIRPQSKSSS